MLNTFQKFKNIKFHISRGKNKRGKRVRSFNRFNFCNFCSFCIATIVTLVTIYTFATSVVFAGIAGTKHDLSSTSTGGGITATGASGVTQKCVFCHTPHSSSKAGPLWNHSFNQGNIYTVLGQPAPEESRVTWPGQPNKGARLCLGCHDGTVALGLLVNVPGSGMGGTVDMTQTYMPCGPTDYNCLGTDFVGALKHLNSFGFGDHMVSIEYDDGLVTAKNTKCANGIPTQGLVAPSTLTGVVRLRPTDHNNTLGSDTRMGVQCRTCHDPHDDPGGNNKFLVIGTPINQNPLCETCHYDRLCP